MCIGLFFFFSSRRRHTRWPRDWSSDVCSSDLGHALDWLPLPGRKACRIQYSKTIDGYDQSLWPEMIAWLVEHAGRLEQALQTHLERTRLELRQLGINRPKQSETVLQPPT